MCTKMVEIVIILLILILFLSGCFTCFLPCNGQWFAIGVLPPGVVVYQKEEEQQKNSESPPLTQNF